MHREEWLTRLGLLYQRVLAGLEDERKLGAALEKIKPTRQEMRKIINVARRSRLSGLSALDYADLTDGGRRTLRGG